MTRTSTFSFGKNWNSYLSTINEDKISEAKLSLIEMLEIDRLVDKSFLDIGSGSGLFSLAARQLGANVHSFDFDPLSVLCTKELYKRYFNGDSCWIIEQGSVLDKTYLNSLGCFDIVYSWGVLHHTGNLWKSLELITPLVKSKGKLFIAIYNDQGFKSRVWNLIKIFYNKLPDKLHPIIVYPLAIAIWGPIIFRDAIKFTPLYSWNRYSKNRGMSPWQDLIDWIGGYPFEVAKPQDVISFYQERGFILRKYKSANGSLGNNEFVFELSI